MPEASVTEAAIPARLLLIETQGAIGAGLDASLAAEFAAMPATVMLESGRPAVELMRGTAFDIVIAEIEALTDLGARIEERIARLARAASGSLLLVLSEDGSVSAAMSAMRAGAHDCVCRSPDGATLAQRLAELARRHGKAHLLRRSGEPSPSAPESPAPSIPGMRDLVLPMWRQEQRIIEDAIQSFAGNIALAAAALELSPSTIYRKRQAWAEMDGKRGAA